MVTGYTAPVADGTVTEFKEFALSCARAFGALITMRDEPMDAPIPDEFRPSTYHADQLIEAQHRLVQVGAMSEPECEEASIEAFETERTSREKIERDDAEENARIQAMLTKVRAWAAPSEDHEGMKKFMIDQLEMSINKPYPRTPIVKLDWAEWKIKELAAARHDIEYHSEENAKEIERANGRTEWVKSLRSSLAAI